MKNFFVVVCLVVCLCLTGVAGLAAGGPEPPPCGGPDEPPCPPCGPRPESAEPCRPDLTVCLENSRSKRVADRGVFLLLRFVASPLGAFCALATMASGQMADVDVVARLAGPGRGLPVATVSGLDVVFRDPMTRETLVRYELANSRGFVRAGFTASVPALEAGWTVSATAAGWWAPTVRVPPDRPKAELTLVPAGEVRLGLRGDGSGSGRLTAGDAEISGWIERGRGLRRGRHEGPCRVVRPGRNGDAAEVVCGFALGKVKDLAVALGSCPPWRVPVVTVTDETDLGVADVATCAAGTKQCESCNGSAW